MTHQQQSSASPFKTEIIHYTNPDTGNIEWSVITVNHPEIEGFWSTLPCGAEWAAKPANKLSGMTWTMLWAYPTNNEGLRNGELVNRSSDFILRANGTISNPITGVGMSESEESKFDALASLLRDNLTVLNTTNVRLKPMGDSLFVW